MISCIAPVSNLCNPHIFINYYRMAKVPEVCEKPKYSLCKISIMEVFLTRMSGSLSLANVFNSQDVMMFSYLYILWRSIYNQFKIFEALLAQHMMVMIHTMDICSSSSTKWLLRVSLLWKIIWGTSYCRMILLTPCCPSEDTSFCAIPDSVVIYYNSPSEMSFYKEQYRNTLFAQYRR